VTDSAATICILCPGGLDHSGGIGRAIGYLIEAWDANDEPPPVRVIDTRGSGHIALSPYYLLKALFEITSLRLRGRLKLLHVNLSSRGSTARKLILTSVARTLGIPYLIHLHGSGYDLFYQGLPKSARSTVRWMFAGATRVVVLGEHWRAFVMQKVGVDPTRIEIVYNVVPSFGGGIRRFRGQGHSQILFLGRLGERKGVPDLLAALARPEIARLPWRATFAGDGDIEKFMVTARRLGLQSRIDFPGWVASDAVAGLLDSADILVLPSYREGLPVAVIEALAHEVAVITTPVGAVPEFLTHYHSALLVEPGDVDRLAQAVGELVQDPSLRDAIAANGFQVYKRLFSIDIISIKMRRIYCDATSQPN
jgi:glycosyltransferase involved in cell wall biosynthesis